jgi:hypothetical protein
MTSDPHALRDGTVDRLLERSHRTGGVPIRNAFVQQGSQRSPRPGRLKDLVSAHDERALDLYLLQRAVASADPWDVRLDARVWARALGLPAGEDTGAVAVSRTWARLARHGLVKRERAGRLSRVTALHESGTGRAYTYPKGNTRRGRYFQIPVEFWLSDKRWYRTLTLAAKAMLLIGSSLKPGFVLPQDQIPAWYGVSTDTGVRGLHELKAKGLLTFTKEDREDLLSPEGYVIQHRYTLAGELAQTWPSVTLATISTLPAAATG